MKTRTPILLIHGLFGSLGDPRILGAFGEVTAFAPDLLGYGGQRLATVSEPTLEQQADHVAASVSQEGVGAVHVVGHSIGGAVAVLFATKYPGLTRSLTSVEGNFTIKDGLWSSQIATKEIAEIDAMLRGYKADVAGWLRGTVPTPSEWSLAVASQWLDNQPAATLRAQARAVVDATGKPAYLETIKRILDSKTPLHLIAGERSRGDWDVPEWVTAAAASDTEIKGAGHLMMLEQPDEFAAAICRNLT